MPPAPKALEMSDKLIDAQGRLDDYQCVKCAKTIRVCRKFDDNRTLRIKSAETAVVVSHSSKRLFA